jgi:hypothetical protein
MDYKIEINCDNAAFEDDPALEIARILNNLADNLKHDPALNTEKLRDINGNFVGFAKMVDYE